MLEFLKGDPTKKLKKTYAQKLEAAMTAQRNGDIKTYSELTAEAQALYSQIEAATEKTTDDNR